MYVSRKDAEAMIRAFCPNGEIFGVRFIKKDGTERTMSCRLGVQKGITGAGKPWDRNDYPNLMTVYDMNRQGFRTVNLETLMNVALRRFQVRVV
jgi:hypothetical protein